MTLSNGHGVWLSYKKLNNAKFKSNTRPPAALWKEQRKKSSTLPNHNCFLCSTFFSPEHAKETIRHSFFQFVFCTKFRYQKFSLRKHASVFFIPYYQLGQCRQFSI